MIRNLIIAAFILTTAGTCRSQNFGLGLAAVYNFQTESFGPEIRAEFVKGDLSLVPQITYFPGFNKIKEYYAGLSIHLTMLSYGKTYLYGIAHGSYNGWINHDLSLMEKARYSNWDAELGAGLKMGKCWQPFLESRYNFKWKESTLRIGLVYFFNCSKKGKRKKAVSCPAYDY